MTKFIDNENIIDHSKQSKRLIFIDLMRAFAILMMVQGHTVDTVLDPIYRDNNNIFYFLWNFFRGITAPVFFFSSGAIFSYLLLRKIELPYWKNERVVKGFRRVLFLLFTGYLLRFNIGIIKNIHNLDFFSFKSSFAVDALHCIAIGLLFLLLLFGLYKLIKIPVWLSYPLMGTILFFLYPLFYNTNWLYYFPLPVANYFSADYGSNFPIIPWAGFVMFGGFYGYLLSKPAGLAYNISFSLGTITFGLILVLFSGAILGTIYDITGINDFIFLQNHNFQFFHLGNVLIICGLLSIISNKYPIPEFLSIVGKKTMMIYIVHIFVIYGTGINHGFRYYIGNSLPPFQTAILAIIMVIFFIVLAQYTTEFKNFFLSLFKRTKS
jgi:uncharacterized membrane protein